MERGPTVNKQMEQLEQMMRFIQDYLLLILIAAAVLFVLGKVIQWTIYAKAGQPGWACLIPIYDTVVFMHVVGRSGWHILIFFIPFYGQFIFPLILLYQLAKVFGYGFGFFLGLLFLPFLFFPILAIAGKYVGPSGKRGRPLPGYGDEEYEEPADRPRQRIPARKPIPEDSFEEDEPPAPPAPKKSSPIKAAPSPKVKAAPAPAGDGKVLVQCTNCNKRLKVAATVMGKKVKCPGCGAAFVAS
jgi:uncharacterized protein DUF5684